ncbi:hypothetical protein HSB1_25790 [Halogranum salarium B-1]|uniref:Uncharacterized protein n=1 Tax=Halogranum salarium B-1 TaxID=1210908 RepID=J3A1H2_9EURY|nr:hypothetical protein HSB1_25790 [Halogranum salarium B-1]
MSHTRVRRAVIASEVEELGRGLKVCSRREAVGPETASDSRVE